MIDQYKNIFQNTTEIFVDTLKMITINISNEQINWHPSKETKC
jgi:hypothetical protein